MSTYHPSNRPETARGGRKTRNGGRKWENTTHLEVTFDQQPTSASTNSRLENPKYRQAIHDTRQRKSAVSQNARSSGTDKSRNNDRRKALPKNHLLKTAQQQQQPIGRHINHQIQPQTEQGHHGFPDPCLQRSNEQLRPSRPRTPNEMGGLHEAIPKKRKPNKTAPPNVCDGTDNTSEDEAAVNTPPHKSSVSSSIPTTSSRHGKQQRSFAWEVVDGLDNQHWTGVDTSNLGNREDPVDLMNDEKDDDQKMAAATNDQRSSISSTLSSDLADSPPKQQSKPMPLMIKKHNGRQRGRKRKGGQPIQPGCSRAPQGTMQQAAGGVEDFKRELQQNTYTIYGNGARSPPAPKPRKSRRQPPIKSAIVTNNNNFCIKEGSKSDESSEDPLGDDNDSFHVKGYLEDSRDGKRRAESATAKRVTRSSKKKPLPQKKSPEIIAIDDSDDDDLASKDLYDFGWVDVARIAIGKKVHSHSCQVIIKNNSLTLRFETKDDGKRSSRSSRGGKIVDKEIYFNDWIEFKYYILDEELDDYKKSSFFALGVEPTRQNGLTHYKEAYDPKGEDLFKKYIVVEFRGDIEDMVADLKQCQPAYVNDETRLKADETDNYFKALADEEKRARRKVLLRHQNKKREKSGFLAGKKDADVLLVYPFGPASMAHQIDDAAANLNELSIVTENQPKEITVDNDDEKDVHGNLQLQVVDYEKLDDGEFLNDDLIDFWLRWIQRNSESNDIHVFSTHFYSQLESNGPEAVASWTKKRDIDIFSKKLIFIPINKDLHWTLCVIVNPGAISLHLKILELFTEENCDSDFNEWDNNPFPCMLFFDSLGTHGKGTTSKNIRRWLLSEWNRTGKGVGKNPFTTSNMLFLSPKVPCQMNGWDCGVFVCRFAYALYRLRDRSFTYREADYHPRLSRRTLVFKKMITESEEFQFGMEEISQIRLDMKQLIKNLSEIYLPWKQAEDEKRKAAKKAARLLKSDAAEQNVKDSKGFFASGAPNVASLATTQSKDDSVGTNTDRLSRLSDSSAGDSAPATQEATVPNSTPSAATAVIVTEGSGADKAVTASPSNTETASSPDTGKPCSSPTTDQRTAPDLLLGPEEPKEKENSECNLLTSSQEVAKEIVGRESFGAGADATLEMVTGESLTDANGVPVEEAELGLQKMHIDEGPQSQGSIDSI